MKRKPIKTQRINLFLNPKIVTLAKIRALKEGKSLSKLVEELLTK